MQHRNISFVIMTMLFLFINSCSDSSTDPNQSESGTLTLKLTDAPFPVELATRAEVTIDLITIKSQEDIDSDSLKVLFEGSAVFNLLDYRNGVTATISQVEIPTGIYNQIRMRVVNAEIELTDGRIFNLVIPSGAQTGLKINIHPFLQINNESTNEIILDFDIEKSFVMQGNLNNITGFHFKPVIRAANVSNTGKFFGTITDTNGNTLENIRVWAERDSIISSTFSNTAGEYALIGIPAGIYSLSASGDGYTTTTIPNLELLAGGESHHVFQLAPQ